MIKLNLFIYYYVKKKEKPDLGLNTIEKIKPSHQLALVFTPYYFEVPKQKPRKFSQ